MKSPYTPTPSDTISQSPDHSRAPCRSPINFTAVFSEPVSGFTGTDVTIGGTAGGTKTVTVSGGPSTYNVAVSGITTGGTVIASIAAGVAQDAAGNRTEDYTTAVHTLTIIAPFTQPPRPPKPTPFPSTTLFRSFSEPVSGFTGTDVTIGGTAGGTKTVTVSGGPSTYNVAVSGMTTAGTVIASISAGVAQDAAGNLNTASTSTEDRKSVE